MPKVDIEKCIGCGLCTTMCSDVFVLKEDGKSHVKEGVSNNDPCIKESILGCPVQAISE